MKSFLVLFVFALFLSSCASFYTKEYPLPNGDTGYIISGCDSNDCFAFAEKACYPKKYRTLKRKGPPSHEIIIECGLFKKKKKEGGFDKRLDKHFKK